MNTQEKHYENKWVEVSSFYKLPISNGVFKLYDLIKNWESLSHLNKLEKVEVKQFYFNTGNTAYSKAESYKLINTRKLKIFILLDLETMALVHRFTNGMAHSQNGKTIQQQKQWLIL